MPNWGLVQLLYGQMSHDIVFPQDGSALAAPKETTPRYSHPSRLDSSVCWWVPVTVYMTNLYKCAQDTTEEPHSRTLIGDAWQQCHCQRGWTLHATSSAPQKATTRDLTCCMSVCPQGAPTQPIIYVHQRCCLCGGWQNKYIYLCYVLTGHFMWKNRKHPGPGPGSEPGPGTGPGTGPRTGEN